MKHLTIIMTAIALMAILALPATAQMRMRGEYGRGQHNVIDITKMPDLNVTHEQAVKLRTLRENNLREIKPYLDQMRTRSMELKEIWLMREPDRLKIESLQYEILKLRAQILEINAAYRQGNLKLLTEKQRAILESCEERRGYGFGRGTQGRSGMDGPE